MIYLLKISIGTLHIENKTTTECRVYHIDSKVFGFFYNIWVAILKDLYKLEGGSHTYMGSVRIMIIKNICNDQFILIGSNSKLKGYILQRRRQMLI